MSSLKIRPYGTDSLSLKEFTQWVLAPQSSTTQEHLLDFLLHLQSSHTRRVYKFDIVEFFEFIYLHFKIDNMDYIGEKEVLYWYESLKKKNLTARTLARKISALSSFFEFSLKNGWKEKNPIFILKRPRFSHQGKTPALTREDAQKILELCLLKIEESKNALQRRKEKELFLAILLLFSTGIRISELCSLKYGDFLVTDKGIFISLQLKGGSREQHPLTEELTVYIKDKLTIMSPYVSLEDPFFSLGQGKSIVPSTLFKRLVLLGEECQIPIPVTPHVLRATYATLLYEQGIPLVQIQYLMHHQSLSTTALYLRRKDNKENAAGLKANFFE